MISISDHTYMRAEPIYAIPISLFDGILPSSKRLGSVPNIKSHVPNYVSIGKGNIKTNPAFMDVFFNENSLIYVISPQIEYCKGFKPNSTHPQSAEYLVKKIPSDLIVGIISHSWNINIITHMIDKIKPIPIIINPLETIRSHEHQALPNN